MIDNDEGTVLAFDFGDVRIGVARADLFAKLPEPLATIDRNDQPAIDELVYRHNPSVLVVGLPRTLDGKDSQQTHKARAFAKHLERFGLPVKLQDEALTTEAALQRGGGAELDALAAVVILEDYLRERT